MTHLTCGNSMRSEHPFAMMSDEESPRDASTSGGTAKTVGGLDMAKRTCSIAGCERSAYCRGWCKMHYSRVLRLGSPDLAKREKELPCTVTGCSTLRECRGLCVKHYNRWRVHGDPLHAKLIIGDPVGRFWTKVEKTDSCWLWRGALDRKGYGHFTIGHQTKSAHRYAYELLVGPIPEGLHIDHLCRVHNCVNPEHLEPVTTKENTRRGLRGVLLTHCPRGHAYDERNTGWGQRGRYCRACHRERYHERKKSS